MEIKENYYITENIEKRAKEFLEKIKPYSRKQDTRFLPEKSALLILDMQKYFLDESSHAYIPSSKAIIPGIKELQNAYLKKRLLVVQTRHLNTTSDAGSMQRWWKDLITEDNPLSKVVDELFDERIPVVHKTQYDAFWKTDLQQRLNKAGVKQVVVTGVMTHLCCETTARSAFMKGFDVFFTVDGTATYNKMFHLSTLINLSHGFAVPVTVKEILQHLHNWGRVNE